MPQYLFLIFEDESKYVDADAAQWQRMMELHGAFTHAVADQGGTVVGGNALQPTTTATSIRAGITTDGPFVESKEALGGYYLIEASDLDHALKLAAQCPAPYGGVEVRPVMDVG